MVPQRKNIQSSLQKLFVLAILGVDYWYLEKKPLTISGYLFQNIIIYSLRLRIFHRWYINILGNKHNPLLIPPPSPFQYLPLFILFLLADDISFLPQFEELLMEFSFVLLDLFFLEISLSIRLFFSLVKAFSPHSLRVRVSQRIWENWKNIFLEILQNSYFWNNF